MLFSAHVADTGPTVAMRGQAPTAATVPGLKSARRMFCAPFGRSLVPRLQPGRAALVACWEHDQALDDFLAHHPAGLAFAEGWHARMRLFRAVGVWPGLDDDMRAEAARTTEPVGPTIALTIGTFYVRRLPAFLRANAPLEQQFLEAPDAIWGTGLANVARRGIGTLTIWDSAGAAERYMRTGAHRAAVREHYDPRKDPTGHTFVTGGGFFGFAPVSVAGSLDGRNPIAANVAVA